MAERIAEARCTVSLPGGLRAGYVYRVNLDSPYVQERIANDHLILLGPPDHHLIEIPDGDVGPTGIIEVDESPEAPAEGATGDSPEGE